MLEETPHEGFVSLDEFLPIPNSCTLLQWVVFSTSKNLKSKYFVVIDIVWTPFTSSPEIVISLNVFLSYTIHILQFKKNRIFFFQRHFLKDLILWLYFCFCQPLKDVSENEVNLVFCKKILHHNEK